MGCGRSTELGSTTGKPLLDGSPASSINRKELRRLSRKELRRRLRDLGAAPSEGDGLGFKALADTVLLWNAMTRVRLCDGAERAAALSAIRHEGIAVDILMRGLIVAGVPECERKEAKDKKTAARMLHWTLAKDILKVCADSFATKYKPPESDPVELLIDVFREWQALVNGRVVNSNDNVLEGNAGIDAAQVRLSDKKARKESSVTKDEGVHTNGAAAGVHTNGAAAQRSGNDVFDGKRKHSQEHGASNNAATKIVSSKATPHMPKSNSAAKPAEFAKAIGNVQNSDMKEFLITNERCVLVSDVSEMKRDVPVVKPGQGLLSLTRAGNPQLNADKAFIQGVPLAKPSQSLLNITRPMNPQPKSEKALVVPKRDKSTRDQKFEALDAELTSWLDSHGDDKEVASAFKTFNQSVHVPK